MNRILTLLLLLITSSSLSFAQMIDQDGFGGNNNARGKNTSQRDTVGHQEVHKGITVWTVNSITGDRTPAVPDTTSYLRMNYGLPSGIFGEYSTLGNNGSPRLNRIFIDRPSEDDFIFTNGYSQILVRHEDFHFTNTYSPITNLDFNECGDKNNGEDKLKALFAVNVNKQLGFGFKFDYLYARGYYANQSTSHFNYSMWGSYLGDRYEAHLLMSTNHQKQAENGGIANDAYITHPEQFSDNFSENDIPTFLSDTWNRNDNQHIFFTHRYNIGFKRRVPMTPEEIEAKKFAMEAEKEKKEREQREKDGDDDDDDNNSRRNSKKVKKDAAPTGRPDGAKIVGNEPGKQEEPRDSTRIAMTTEQAKDSLMAEKEKKEEDEFMKDEYVPVTSFFHTLNLDNYRRTFLAYESPAGYYKDDYYGLKNDSINDRVRHLHIRNTLGISMLEGFNKWVKAGLKLYGAYQYKQFALPTMEGGFDKFNEGDLIVGGEISKRQGNTLHFNANGEFYVLGDNIGQISANGGIDLNFPLLGDTVRLDACGSFNLFDASPLLYRYQSRHFQWNVEDEFSKTTHIHAEGNLSWQKTDTRVRVAVDNLTNYTYLGTSYNINISENDPNHTITDLTLAPKQASNVQVYTAQLYQNLKVGILHWDNIFTFQKSSDEVALPLPKFNIYSTLYLRFKIAKVLDTDLGVDVRYFSKYDAPEYSPQMQTFVIQENEEIRQSVGNYPICNAYANFQLKSCRFYIMMSHVNCTGSGNYFLTPHYPINSRVLRIGLNWNFFN